MLNDTFSVIFKHRAPCKMYTNVVFDNFCKFKNWGLAKGERACIWASAFFWWMSLLWVVTRFLRREAYHNNERVSASPALASSCPYWVSQQPRGNLMVLALRLKNRPSLPRLRKLRALSKHFMRYKLVLGPILTSLQKSLIHYAYIRTETG